MTKNISVSLIQANIVWENKSKNLDYFSREINSLKNSSDLIILPEMFNSGFSLNPEKNHETQNGETIKWIIKEATEKKVAIAGSLIIKENNNFYNRLVFVYPNGDIRFYNKRHLFRMAGEHNYYTAGEKKVVIEYLGWKIILLVCYDLRFPVWSRNIDNQYDMMIYVANWPHSRIEQWETLLTARAIENQAYVVGVNRVGTDGNNFYYSGSSKIITPKGENLINTKKDEVTCKTAELDYKKLSKYRENFPVSSDADKFSINVE